VDITLVPLNEIILGTVRNFKRFAISAKGIGSDFRKPKWAVREKQAVDLKYDLEPTGCCGLNVCVERDIWRQATGAACC
jgi:hypothetical protein